MPSIWQGPFFFLPRITIPTPYLPYTYHMRTGYGMFTIVLKYSNLAHSI